VLRLFTLPEFKVNTKATECALQNGTAELVILNNSDIANVEWSIDNGVPFSTDYSVSGLAPGTYVVKATSSLNCSDTLHFTIKTEITIYNGISANNDGMNDFFEISCIEDFPTNNVRIFNRAGTLVYEIRGYNNQDVMFNGVSNRGVSVLGKELPEGTYFYIIDKGDGSEPKTGYLELLR
jgi:gliding motility-associated-like protein